MTQGWSAGPYSCHGPDRGPLLRGESPAQRRCYSIPDAICCRPYVRSPELRRPVPAAPNFPVVNFLDAGTLLSVLLTAELGDLNVGVYGDGRYSYQMSIYVIRVQKETMVTVMFLDNPIARESVDRYPKCSRPSSSASPKVEGIGNRLR